MVSASLAFSRRNGTLCARASCGVSHTSAPPTVNASAPIAAPLIRSRRSIGFIAPPREPECFSVGLSARDRLGALAMTLLSKYSHCAERSAKAISTKDRSPLLRSYLQLSNIPDVRQYLFAEEFESVHQQAQVTRSGGLNH